MADWAGTIEHEVSKASAAAIAAALDPERFDVVELEHLDGWLECLPPLETVVPAGGIFDAHATYAREPDFRIPALVDDVAATRLRDAALAMFCAVGAKGLARVDFFVTDERVLPNEINTFPGFTPPAAAGAPHGGVRRTRLPGARRTARRTARRDGARAVGRAPCAAEAQRHSCDSAMSASDGRP